MGTLAQKLQYTVDAVDGIEVALQNKGLETNGVPLGEYAGLIDSISSGGGSVDREGLAALGYTEEEIDLFQNIVTWDSKLDAVNMVSELDKSQNSITDWDSLSVNTTWLPKAIFENGIPYRATELPYIKLVVIPEGSVLSTYGFYEEGWGLEAVSMPSNYDRFNGYDMDGAVDLKILDFRRATEIPTATSLSAASFKIIYVPKALEAEWKIATNWVLYADKIIGV